jgi:uncharacterized protein (TIGR02597 family)
MSHARWKIFSGFTLAGLVALTTLAADPVTLTSLPVGFANLTAPANTDVLVSPCFARPSVYSGSIGGLNGAFITAAGSPAWVANSWVYSSPSQPDTYYLRFTSGSAAGRCYTVTANTSQTVTIDWNGETPAAAVNDTFSIIPYWTLGTLYPAADAGSTFTTSSSDSVRGTEILFSAQASAGVNLSTSATYYFLGGSWRKDGGSPTSSFDDVVVTPGSYIIQRNKDTATVVSVYGRVANGVISAVLSAQGGTAKQDNSVALAFPGTVTLNDSHLVGSGAFSASTSPLFHADELYVFDNATTGIKKAAAAVYYYYNAAWRKVGAPITSDFGATAIFVPGTGVIVRKSGTGSSAATTYWTYTSPVN